MGIENLIAAKVEDQRLVTAMGDLDLGQVAGPGELPGRVCLTLPGWSVVLFPAGEPQDYLWQGSLRIAEVHQVDGAGMVSLILVHEGGESLKDLPFAPGDGSPCRIPGGWDDRERWPARQRGALGAPGSIGREAGQVDRISDTAGRQIGTLPGAGFLDKRGASDRIFRCGRLAQVDRALVSGTKGRAFESPIAHHIISIS